MLDLFAALLAAGLLVIAGYAQWRMSDHTSGAGRTALARGILVAVGLAFGAVAATL